MAPKYIMTMHTSTTCADTRRRAELEENEGATLSARTARRTRPTAGTRCRKMLYATYNSVTAPKELHPYQLTGHYWFQEQRDEWEAWLLRQMGL